MLGTWKYLSLKTIQSYSVFYALSNGVDFIRRTRSQKFSPVDMALKTMKLISFRLFLLDGAPENFIISILPDRARLPLQSYICPVLGSKITLKLAVAFDVITTGIPSVSFFY